MNTKFIKKMILGFAVLAITGMAVFNLNVNLRTGLSDIALANIEALARNEGSGNTNTYECILYCMPSLYYDCIVEVNNSGTWEIYLTCTWARN